MYTHLFKGNGNNQWSKPFATKGAPAPAKPVVGATHAHLKALMGSKAVQGTGGEYHTKAYSANYAEQKAQQDAVHKYLKDKGYKLGKTTTVPGKSYLKSTEYHHPDAPSLVAEYHTPQKAGTKGGKLEIKPSGNTKAMNNLMAPAPQPKAVAPSKGGDHQPHGDGFHEIDNALFPTTRVTFMKGNSANVKKLSAEEKAAITAYTGSAYGSINSILRKKPGSENLSHEYHKQAEHIKAALAKSQLAMGIVVHRGFNGNTATRLLEAHNSGKIVGTHVSDDGIVSTTTNYGFAKSWASMTGATGGASKKVTATVRVPKGHPALYVEGMTKNKNEHEVLLPPKTKMVVTKVVETDYTVVLHMDAVHSP